ncbi:TonB-dependent siderophore receptor [Sphingomonas sp. 22176]|uniref:TonB-dependent siderophore receptor n=1 Tax=Sphingomonas sp. 22176 TaxID=3453884 RepID=UPI003F86C20B
MSSSYVLALSAAALAIVQPTPGRAQADQAGADDGSIVVTGQRTIDRTATKTDTPLILTPQMISVIDRSQIQLQNIQTVTQALRYVPGVQTELGGADNRIEANQFTIRGFVPQEYLDGLRLQSGSWAAPQFDPYALDRIDVLKGPSSVLYGQSSPGGLVALTSRRPSATPGGEVMFQTGNWNRLQGAADITGPLTGDGQLSYRLTGLVRDTDTQIDHTKYRKWFVAPAISWHPDSATEFTILANYQREPDGGFYNQIPSPGSGQSSPFGKIPTSFYGGEPDYDRLHRTQESIGYSFSHRFSDVWQFRSNFRYMHISTDYRTVLFEALAADGHTLQRSPYQAIEKLNTLAIDNQMQGDFDTGPIKHKLLVGLDYQYSKWDHQAYYGFKAAPTLDWLDPVYGKQIPTAAIFQNGLQKQNQTGIYAQDQLSLGGMNLVLGGREDWVSISDQNRLTGRLTDLDQRAFTGRAGLIYLFDFGLAPYVSYSTSFQPILGAGFDGVLFRPTRGKQYEAGVKYQPVSFPGFVTASVYKLTQSNVTTADPAHAGATAQLGEYEAKGIELDGHLTPIKGLDLRATYGHLDIKVSDAPAASGLKGKVPPSNAKNTATVWADYAPTGSALAGLTIGGGVRYIGKSYGNFANSYQVVDNVLLDAVIGYDLAHLSPRLAHWSVQLNATNLLDKTYVSSCGNLGCYYGLRRQIIANIRYAW